jgi:hypothetical protein
MSFTVAMMKTSSLLIARSKPVIASARAHLIVPEMGNNIDRRNHAARPKQATRPQPDTVNQKLLPVKLAPHPVRTPTDYVAQFSQRRSLILGKWLMSAVTSVKLCRIHCAAINGSKAPISLPCALRTALISPAILASSLSKSTVSRLPARKRSNLLAFRGMSELLYTPYQSSWRTIDDTSRF